MATQRITVLRVVGDAGRAVASQFRAWPRPPEGADALPIVAPQVDHLAELLRSKAAQLPVVYFCEWIDGWLMGDLVPGPEAISGVRFQAACHSPSEAEVLAASCPDQFPEQQWFAARLREAADTCEWLSPDSAIVVLREVLGGSTTDEEIKRSLFGVPQWLAAALTPPRSLAIAERGNVIGAAAVAASAQRC